MFSVRDLLPILWIFGVVPAFHQPILVSSGYVTFGMKEGERRIGKVRYYKMVKVEVMSMVFGDDVSKGGGEDSGLVPRH